MLGVVAKLINNDTVGANFSGHYLQNRKVLVALLGVLINNQTKHTRPKCKTMKTMSALALNAVVHQLTDLKFPANLTKSNWFPLFE